jgi:Holliday junction DNA helicase RuvB
MKSKAEIKAAAAIKSGAVVDAVVDLPQGDVVAEETGVLPKSFAEMIGQKELLRRLTKLVELARSHQQPLGHTLLVGPDGCGKSTTARIIARELGVNLREVPSQIERAGDLNAMIADLDEGDVFFVQNIGRLRRELISVIVDVMRDFELRIVVGKGPGARAMRLAVKPFTLVGTVEKQSDCPRDLLNAFHMVLPFHPYNEAEIVEFAARLTAQAGIALEPPTKALVARLSDGNFARAEMMMSKLKLIEKQPVNEHDA